MKVVLLGDSIRMGYQANVVRKFNGAELWGPDINGRHSQWELDHFDEWVTAQEPDVVHVNFGIHDTSPMADGAPQILLPQYRTNLQRFIARVKALKGVRMIWATTTPVYAPDGTTPMAQWPISPLHSIDEYNAAALEIVQGEGFPVNDLHAEILANDFTKCICEDGCHMTDFGNEVLSDAVVTAIRQ